MIFNSAIYIENPSTPVSAGELHMILLSNGAVVGGTSTSKKSPFLNPITLSLNPNAPELKGGTEIDRCFFCMDAVRLLS